jgi:hypothetical protein
MNSKILQFSLCAAGALLLGGSALAQQNAGALHVAAGVKNAGVYHVATNTWTPASTDPIATLGTDVLYDNTCVPTTFIWWWGAYNHVITDIGRIPSSTSPTNPTSVKGTGTSYAVDGFTAGWCSAGHVGPTTVNFAWYECYGVCSDASLLTPLMALSVLLPANGGCWTGTIDLANTTFAFTISADCNGSYQQVQNTDSFGWSISDAVPAPGTTLGGILAGDYFGLNSGGVGTGCPYGDGTVWKPGIGDGTGVGSVDAFEAIDFTPVPYVVWCYYFGGYAAGTPYAAFYHEVIGSATATSVGTPGCFCDLANAPCGNNYDTGGCKNSTGVGAIISGTGTTFVVNDDLVLSVVQSRPSKPGVWLQGSNVQQIQFKDGNLCVANPTVRIWGDVLTDATGYNDTTDLPQGGLVAQLSFKGYTVNPGDILWYQWWYRDGGGPCLQQSNLSNNLQITWQ